ncbi:hypothetical protein OFM21_32790, partial [Escherichia coli]|nr:hypothetical protein [Escherichia coli]
KKKSLEYLSGIAFFRHLLFELALKDPVVDRLRHFQLLLETMRVLRFLEPFEEQTALIQELDKSIQTMKTTFLGESQKFVQQ